MKIRIEFDYNDLNAYEDADLIIGIARRYLYPKLTQDEKDRLNMGGQSQNAYITRVLKLMKAKGLPEIEVEGE